MDIIAHRGASAEQPENTFAAFERALELGVDGLEADLLLSKDGRIVVRHNDLVQTPAGPRYVRELTLAELQALDVGDGQRMPSLEEFLERFGGRTLLVLDIKTFGVAGPLARVLAAHQDVRPVRVTSFLHEEIAELGRRLPAIDRSVTLAAMLVDIEAALQGANTRAVALFRAYVSEAVVRRLRAAGVCVRVYPVNLPREAETFSRWGVEAIYTDDPAAMQPFRTSPR